MRILRHESQINFSKSHPFEKKSQFFKNEIQINNEKKLQKGSVSISLNQTTAISSPALQKKIVSL